MDTAAALLLVVYLVPFAVAEAYGHRHRYAVLALNMLTGWTGVGWVAALVWALRARPRPAPPPPQLYVVGQPPPVELPGFWRTTWPATWMAIAVCAAGAGLFLLPATPPERVEVSTRAGLAVERTELRAGPSDAWPRDGVLEQPCQLHVSARQGDWRRVWPLSPCGGDSASSAGWLRASDLTAH